MLKIKKKCLMDLPNLKYLNILHLGLLIPWNILKFMQYSPKIRCLCIGSDVFFYKLTQKKQYFPLCISEKGFSYNFPSAMKEMEKIDNFFEDTTFDQANQRFPQQRAKINFIVSMKSEIGFLLCFSFVCNLLLFCNSFFIAELNTVSSVEDTV